MPDEEKLAVHFSSKTVDRMIEEQGGRFRTVKEILDALGDDERTRAIEDLRAAIDDRVRWLLAIREQCKEEGKSIHEALQLRDSVAMFLREFPIPHRPGADLVQIVIPALKRERMASSGPLLRRLFRSVWIALKGDIE